MKILKKNDFISEGKLDKLDDASKKLLGFKYQEMVALIKCLESKDNRSIYLECYGDVSDKTVSIEVKHSINKNKKLINTHIDFWKTIYNCLINYDSYKFYSKFILHTTADIKEDSIFEGWNDKSSQEKVKNILSVNSTNTISKYINFINNFDKVNLENILEKFIIHSNQKNAQDFYVDILCLHPSITNALKEEDRKSFINSMLGYLSYELITAKEYKWEINISSFHENFQSYLKQYQIDELIFPKSNKKIDETNKRNFRFVQELESIEYDDLIGMAFKNYIKAADSRIIMLTKRNSLSERLDDFDEEIKEQFESNIISHIDKLRTETDYNINEKSRRFVDCTEKKVSSEKEIEGVRGVKHYYPKGRLYHCIEEEESLSCKLKVQNEIK